MLDLPDVERVVDDAVDVSISEGHSAASPSVFGRPKLRAQTQSIVFLLDLP